MARRTGRFPQLVDSRSGVNCVRSPLFRREHSPASAHMRMNATETRNLTTVPDRSASGLEDVPLLTRCAE